MPLPPGLGPHPRPPLGQRRASGPAGRTPPAADRDPGADQAGPRRRSAAAVERARPRPPDRERVLRTLITDVTLTSSPAGDQIRVGIFWRSGACEEQVAARARMRTGQETVELIRRLKLEGLHDTDIAAELRALGLRTAWGNEFRTRDVRNVRHSIGLARPAGSPRERI